jgi:hypothetical protein
MWPSRTCLTIPLFTKRARGTFVAMCNTVNILSAGLPARKLRLRTAQSGDRERLKEFAKQTQDVASAARDPVAMMNSRELQVIYVVEEIGTYQIVAASACCAHCDGRFVEVGRAIVRWKGYGLQRLLTRISTIKSLAMTSGEVRLFCIVEGTQAGLKHRMRELGFDDWGAPPQELVDDLNDQGFSGGDYMLFANSEVEAHRQSLLGILHSPVLRHLNGGEVVDITFDTLFTGDMDFREALETAAPLPT